MKHYIGIYENALSVNLHYNGQIIYFNCSLVVQLENKAVFLIGQNGAKVELRLGRDYDFYGVSYDNFYGGKSNV